MSSHAPKRGLHLPEPFGQEPTDAYFALGYRAGEVIPGPDLFVRSRPGGRPIQLLDPLTQTEHENGVPETLDCDTRYLRRLRYLQIGSYEFDIHMLGSEVDNPAIPDIRILRQVSYALPPASHDEQFRPTKHVLGEGSFGIVRISKSVRTGTVLACKEMFFDRRRPDVEAEMQQAVHERDLSIALRHPNVIRTFFGDAHDDLQESTGEIVMTRYRMMMDPCPLSLADMIRVDLAHDYLLHAATDVVAGLSFMHGRGVAHRDLKPGNILVRFDYLHERIFAITKSQRHQHLDFSQPFTFCLADFGLSRHRRNGFMTFCGTRQYLAPELRIKDDDANGAEMPGVYSEAMYTNAVDMYALGVTLFEIRDSTSMEAAMGPSNVPNWGSFLDVVKQRRHNDWMWQLIYRLLHDDPARRPLAENMLEELESAPPLSQSDISSLATSSPRHQNWTGSTLEIDSQVTGGDPSTALDSPNSPADNLEVVRSSFSPETLQQVVGTIKSVLPVAQSPTRKPPQETSVNLRRPAGQTKSVRFHLSASEQAENVITAQKAKRTASFRFPDRMEGLFNASLSSDEGSTIRSAQSAAKPQEIKRTSRFRFPDRMEGLFDISLNSDEAPTIRPARTTVLASIHEDEAGPPFSGRFDNMFASAANHANEGKKRKPKRDSSSYDPLGKVDAGRVDRKSNASQRRNAGGLDALSSKHRSKPLKPGLMDKMLIAVDTFANIVSIGYDGALNNAAVSAIRRAISQAFDNAIDNEKFYKDSLCVRVPGAFYSVRIAEH
ncbi:hypothetical protein KVT40_003224 [Elsinoe batatas]|uniref:Protein kinase domain-containing protein n=1 Tax=Elsinoe batatas TaxID=2601811 RepID=A0A8K0L452_9PEZI|nr:hypothetical protein KVT40_003224 [Elsinoe batatas]